jgi:predicted NACHT family NTPase
LASTPLFLTLLCITFTDWGFTENRLELYDNCVDVLLKKWDAARGVVGRHQASSLGQKGKKKKLLSKIAYPNFYNNIYYFDRSEIIKQISNYVKNIPRIDLDNVEEESEDVLNSFEVSHGLLVQQYVNVYSFAHLSFQEYFTAQFIKDNCNQFSLDDENLINLVEHLTEPRWREVFKLVAEMLDNSDCLMQLAKKRIDKLLLTPKLQRFLNWVNEKSISHAVVMTNYNNLAAIRANYFDFDIALDQDRKLGCILDNDFTISFTCASFLARAQNNEIRDNFSIVSIDSESDLEPAMAVIIARTDAINELLKESNLDLHLKNDLQSLQNEIYPILKNREINKEIFDLWCQENGQNWGDKLRKIIVPFRSLGDSWRYKVVDGNQPQSPDVFSELEEELLRRYYEANLLLVSCLNSESVFTNRDVREEIIKSLLLPIPQDE